MTNKKPILENKIALITGASRGLGKAMALRFAEEGAAVAVNYNKHAQEAEETCRTIVAAGGRALRVQADVAERSQVDRMVETVLREFRQIDILVNNAGVSRAAPLLEASTSDLDFMFAVNLKGVVHCVQAVAKNMIERKYGKILNFSSIAAMGTSYIGTSTYATTKAAVTILTKRMALELGAYNINVNALAPGFVPTGLSLGMQAGGQSGLPREFLEDMARRSMVGRVGQPEDIAAAALFLVSDEASFITAQILTVDGGRKDFLTYSA